MLPLNDLGAALDSAVKQNHLPSATISKALELSNVGDTRAYIKALRARLIELGYLGEQEDNRIKDKPDKRFIAAVKRFQREAGLVEDGWAGPKTWQAMECLVSFENRQSLDEWREWTDECATLDSLTSNSAVLRGLYLRLYSMGFFADWKSTKIKTNTLFDPDTNNVFSDAIDTFLRFASTLQLSPPREEAQVGDSRLDYELLQAVFAYDSIVDRLGQEDFFHAAKTQFPESVDAIARIELWLLGYGTQPGPERIVRKRIGGKPGTARSRRYREQSRLEEAIGHFWRDANRAGFPKSSDSQVSFSLMQQFRNFLQQDTKDIYVGKHINDQVTRILSSSSDKKIFLEQFKSIANSVWDGLKRLTKWLFNALTKVFDITVDMIANVARYVSRKARRFFAYVVKAVDIMHAGLDYLRNESFTGSTPGRAVIAKGYDFDQYCCMDPLLTHNELRRLMTDYSLATATYIAASRVLGHLVRLFSTIVKTMQGPLGWLAAMLALSRLANSIKAIKRDLDLVKQYTIKGAHPKAALTNDVY